jgi:predicted nucleic acid-binding protein
LDTNVLVYAYDVSEAKRRVIAKGLIDDVWNVGGGVLTLQNLSEFFFAVTPKVQKPVPIVDAKTIVADLLRSSRWMVIDRNAGTVMKAMGRGGRRGAVLARSDRGMHARTWHRGYRHGKRERL